MSKTYYAIREFKHQVDTDTFIDYNIGDVVDVDLLGESTFNFFVEAKFISTDKKEKVVGYNQAVREITIQEYFDNENVEKIKDIESEDSSEDDEEENEVADEEEEEQEEENDSEESNEETEDSSEDDEEEKPAPKATKKTSTRRTGRR